MPETQAYPVPEDGSPGTLVSRDHAHRAGGASVPASRSSEGLAIPAHPYFSNYMLRLLFLAMVTGLAGNAANHAEIGQPVSEWELQNWMNSKPLKLSNLRGKVVLIRWWTAPGCPYCANTAPALNEFHRAYAKRGLQVVGAYHHKSDDPLDPKEVERAAKKFGFKFPVAVDPDWHTLNHWWLDHHDAPFTSMSFLLDRQGVLRYVHRGGEYVKGDGDYEQVKQQIERLLEKR
jgi:peroxiredoxin